MSLTNDLTALCRAYNDGEPVLPLIADVLEEMGDPRHVVLRKTFMVPARFMHHGPNRDWSYGWVNGATDHAFVSGAEVSSAVYHALKVRTGRHTYAPLGGRTYFMYAKVYPTRSDAILALATAMISLELFPEVANLAESGK